MSRGAWRLLIAAAALAVVAHLALVPMAETDFFFHLKLGDIIVERHEIPFENLFSFTYPAHADPDLSWGFQVAASLLYRLGGFVGVVIGKTALIVLAAALLLRVAQIAGARPLPAAMAVVLAAVTAEPRFVERPHLVTFVGLGVMQLLVERRRYGWMIPLVLIWANFHAGVFLAPLWLILYATGLWLDGRRRLRLFGIAALMIAAMFATPAGGRLSAYLLWHTGIGSTRVIDEFRVADMWNDPWFFVCAYGCGFVAVTMLAARRAPWALRIGWRRILPLVVVGLLAWRSVRFVAEWALLAAPVIALGLDKLGRSLVALGRRRWWRHVAAAACVTTALVAVARAERAPLGLADDVVPFAAIDFVTRNGLRDRMYSDLDIGCYLLWQGWPRYAVFQDARLPAYPDDMHRALDETPDGPAFEALLSRYGVDTALIAYPGINMRAGAFDPEEWALVWRDDDALVFARRLPRFAAVIAKYEIPIRLRFRFSDGSSAEPLTRPPPRSPVAADEWQRRLAQLTRE